MGLDYGSLGSYMHTYASYRCGDLPISVAFYTEIPNGELDKNVIVGQNYKILLDYSVCDKREKEKEERKEER